MSSSSDTARRVTVLRDRAARRSPELVDLDSLSEAARCAVDPAAVEEAIARGYAEGFADGHRQGLEAGRAEARAEAERAEADHRQQLEAALGAVARAAAELTARREEVIAGLENALVTAAVDLAEAVIGRELTATTTAGRDALVRALRLVDGLEPAIVRLHPADLATIGETADIAPGRDLTVVPDHGIEPGGCVVEVGDGRIDAQIGPALDRIREELAR